MKSSEHIKISSMDNKYGQFNFDFILSPSNPDLLKDLEIDLDQPWPRFECEPENFEIVPQNSHQMEDS